LFTGNASNCFLVLIECQSTTGEAIATALLTTLNVLGLNNDILRRRLLGFCTDGAGNLRGHVKGALCLISEKIGREDLIFLHCMNHKLELAVNEAVSAISQVSHLRMFIDTLYSYYSRSPRNCRLIENVSQELGTIMRKVGKIFDVRWVSSSFRSVDAIYTTLPALSRQLCEASEDTSLKGKDRAKALGMSKKIGSFEFVSQLALIRDVLDTLHGLSLYLQKRDASILDAGDRLQTAMRTLNAMKTCNGLSVAAVLSGIDANGEFRGIKIVKSNGCEEQFAHMRTQFIQAIIDNVTSRFPPATLMEAGAVLSPLSWPDDEDQKLLFGEAHVLRLAKLCHVDSREAVDDFRMYKNNTNRIGNALATLLKRVNIMPISSAECERGFSCMNLNNTDNRGSLSIDSLSALIFIKVNGPKRADFNPSLYVEEWIKAGRHSATDPVTGKTSKGCDTQRVVPFATLF